MRDAFFGVLPLKTTGRIVVSEMPVAVEPIKMETDRDRNHETYPSHAHSTLTSPRANAGW